MLTQTEIQEILQGYDLNNLTIAVLGGHSALDVCHGAKKMGFKTLAICQKGRDKTYSQYYKTRDGKGCIDEVILVDQFAEVVSEEVQEELRKRNAIVVQNRYFWVYCDYQKIENDFRVPIFGNREMLRREERDVEGNQYELLKKAGIRIPKILRSGTESLTDEELKERVNAWFKENQAPLLVKAAEMDRSYERDFFLITNFQNYIEERQQRLEKGYDKKALDGATIEEFVIGPHINFNYFYSPLTGELEVMGSDTRRQSNMDGFLRLTADQQMELIKKGYKPTMVENGHIACTTKESILEKMFELGEKFVAMSKQECAPGILGPFALQGAYVSEKGKEEMVVFDVSMRIPGSPGTRFTPYTGYLYGETMSYGERIGMEVKEAVEQGRVGELLT